MVAHSKRLHRQELIAARIRAAERVQEELETVWLRVVPIGSRSRLGAQSVRNSVGLVSNCTFIDCVEEEEEVYVTIYALEGKVDTGK